MYRLKAMLVPRSKVPLLCGLVFAFIIFVYPGKFLKPLFDFGVQRLTKSKCEVDFPAQFKQIMTNYRGCLINQFMKMDREVWDRTHEAIDACLNKNYSRLFDVKKLDTKDDDFKFIMLPSPNDTTPCYAVTLGVGNDVSAELQLKNFYPQCHFFGADPILESGTIYRTIGKYYQVAVGAESGYQRASVLEKGKYQFQNVTTLNLEIFLKQQIMVYPIDFFWVDNEGAEYDMLRKYIFNTNMGISLCQMPIEMHGPLEKYNMNKTAFSEFLMSLVSKSQFVPLWSKLVYGHVRAFYVNVIDPYCVKKFFLPKLCTKEN